MSTYVVTLIKKPTTDVFKPGYFPRKFRTKHQALDCIGEVQRCGGSATFIRRDYWTDKAPPIHAVKKVRAA